MTVHDKATNQSLSIDDALAVLQNRDIAAGTERVGVADAVRRVLAEDVISDAAVPAHDSSAMDGYALRFADLGADRRLRINGRIAAGHPLPHPLPTGTAARIFTGGAMPEGADTVAMQEFCEVDGEWLNLPADLSIGDNRRRAGEDIAAGTSVVRAGTRLRAQDIGIATSVGRASLLVRKPIAVAVIATGDELRPPGADLPPGCIYDSNRHSVSAALHNLGVQVTDYGIVADRKDAISDALATAARDNDLVITTGGVSAGEEDHVRTAVLEAGRLDFWKLPLKPGRPVAVGEVCGAAFLGLPGNPVSAMVTFWLLGRPLVLRMMGATHVEPTRFPVAALFDYPHRPGRREMLRARLGRTCDGRLGAEIYKSTSSGMLSSLTWADGLAEVREDAGDIRVGDMISFLPYSALDA